MTTLTKEQAATQLDGVRYPNEGSKELHAQMKAAGLVAVFGGSDDLMEFRGAIDDEVGACDGAEAYVNQDGLMISQCDEGADCPYFQTEMLKAKRIKALWCPPVDPRPSWAYETAIPHATFKMIDDDDGGVYCIGIVFDLKDAL